MITAIIGLTLMGIGSAGVCVAAYMEWRTRESVYIIMMKVFPLIFGIGCFVFWILN